MLPALTSFDFMLATKGPPFSRAGWISEPKYDGYRIHIGKEGKRVELRTRKQKDATTWWPELIPSLAKLPGSFVLDAEVCVVDELGRSDFEALQARGRSSGAAAPLVVFCFDLLYRRKDLRSLPLLKRKEWLRDLMPEGASHLLYVSHVEGMGLQLYEQAVAIGLEGIMSKRADSPYVGGRSKDWVKSKQAQWHDGWHRIKRASQ